MSVTVTAKRYHKVKKERDESQSKVDELTKELEQWQEKYENMEQERDAARQRQQELTKDHERVVAEWQRRYERMEQELQEARKRHPSLDKELRKLKGLSETETPLEAGSFKEEVSKTSPWLDGWKVKELAALSMECLHQGQRAHDTRGSKASLAGPLKTKPLEITIVNLSKVTKLEMAANYFHSGKFTTEPVGAIEPGESHTYGVSSQDGRSKTGLKGGIAFAVCNVEGIEETTQLKEEDESAEKENVAEEEKEQAEEKEENEEEKAVNNENGEVIKENKELDEDKELEKFDEPNGEKKEAEKEKEKKKKRFSLKREKKHKHDHSEKPEANEGTEEVPTEVKDEHVDKTEEPAAEAGEEKEENATEEPTTEEAKDGTEEEAKDEAEGDKPAEAEKPAESPGKDEADSAEKKPKEKKKKFSLRKHKKPKDNKVAAKEPENEEEKTDEKVQDQDETDNKEPEPTEDKEVEQDAEPEQTEEKAEPGQTEEAENEEGTPEETPEVVCNGSYFICTFENPLAGIQKAKSSKTQSKDILPVLKKMKSGSPSKQPYGGHYKDGKRHFVYIWKDPELGW